MERALVEAGLVRGLSVVGAVRGPIDYRFSGVKRILIAAYSHAIDVSAFLDTLSACYQFMLPDLNLVDRCLTGFPAMVCIMSLIQNVYIFFRRPRFARLLKDHMSMYADDPQMKAELDRIASYIRLLPWTLFCLMAAVMGPACLTPFLKEIMGQPREIAFPLYYPFDIYKNSFTFFSTVLFQALNATMVPIRIIVFDNFFYCYACRQLALNRKLSKELKEIISIVNISPAGGTTYKINPTGDQLTKEEASKWCAYRLRKWVITHQTSIRLSKELQTLYSPMLVIQFSALTLHLCMNAFVVTEAEMGFIKLMFCALYVLGNLLQLLFICRLGDLITLENLELPDNTVGSFVVTLSKEVNVVIRMILTRVATPYTITAIGLFPLNTETFKSVVLTAYSYFTVLNNIKK